MRLGLHFLKKRHREKFNWLEHIFYGFCMGTADVVPGVSGGTMAFILGVYEDLINTLRMCTDKEFLLTFWNKGPKHALDLLNWKLLIALGAGMLMAILTFAKIIEHLLLTQPLLIWSFFFGLIVASFLILVRRVQSDTMSFILYLLLGTVLGYLLVGLSPTTTPHTWWFLILSGAIAICAMILPGISGSFILVLLGKYSFLLHAVNERDLLPLLLVAIGAGLGLLAFSRGLAWLLTHYHDRTVVVLIGLMVGSIRKIWPWKAMAGSMEYNILPPTLLDSMTLAAIFMMALGFLAVWLLEKLHAAMHSG
ncbi:DUF368 domain-containing protein [Candidatus Peregrinibacteria bacterium CG10_big_fil_rev_8_21_14_0_10_49_16]|nr:MAG: DUF368 domain-containing protein [Candidatus Peregrinibacteria bacterium CG22_combo_CG10-13_8_21_14_all_49_11]PIR51769.1 MAG: DUF368 domain-containing protein [Candidatus Peregrinibacteria bacterium CG10_big_fil_rev_8_21_14_0_10_49_16]